MATKHDEFKVYYFSFDEDEIVTILAALRCHGEEEFADEISEQLRNGDDHVGYTVVVNVDPFSVDAVDQIIKQIEKAQKLGILSPRGE